MEACTAHPPGRLRAGSHGLCVGCSYQFNSQEKRVRGSTSVLGVTGGNVGREVFFLKLHSCARSFRKYLLSAYYVPTLIFLCAYVPEVRLAHRFKVLTGK